MSYRSLVYALMFAALPLAPFAASAQPQTVHVVAGADNTLYQDPDGAVSNGAGAFVLAGRNNLAQDSVRRTVLWFDVAGQLPHGATVQQASLTLYLERGNGGQRVMHLHRLLADWGEGDSSVAGGGLGAPAQPGDATWLHRFYPDAFWGRDGGRYAGRVSASQVVGDPVTGQVDTPGFYTWGGSDRLVDDVRRWQRHPERNFGWILLGDETVSQTAKRFSSRENVDPDLRPVLEIVYTMPQ